MKGREERDKGERKQQRKGDGEAENNRDARECVDEAKSRNHANSGEIHYLFLPR